MSARIIEVVEDEEIVQDAFETTLGKLQASLAIPQQFSGEDWAIGQDATALLKWRSNALKSLKELDITLSMEDIDTLPLELLAVVFILIIPFLGDGSWVLTDTREQASRPWRSLTSVRGSYIVPRRSRSLAFTKSRHAQAHTPDWGKTFIRQSDTASPTSL